MPAVLDFGLLVHSAIYNACTLTARGPGIDRQTNSSGPQLYFQILVVCVAPSGLSHMS